MYARQPLGGFDTRAQLVFGRGELRMTDLASRAFGSRSPTSGQVDRLVEEGLVRRAPAEQDRRGIVVVMARLTVAVPVHFKGGSKLFVERLHDELAVLERALDKGGMGLLI